MTTTTNTNSQLENLLSKFDDNATSWANATDEIRDLARSAREYHNDCDGGEVEALDFRNISTPAKWNTIGKSFIRETYAKMQPNTRRMFDQEIVAPFFTA